MNAKPLDCQAHSPCHKQDLLRERSSDHKHSDKPSTPPPNDAPSYATVLWALSMHSDRWIHMPTNQMSATTTPIHRLCLHAFFWFECQTIRFWHHQNWKPTIPQSKIYPTPPTLHLSSYALSLSSAPNIAVFSDFAFWTWDSSTHQIHKFYSLSK
jgi:hypothetical protein